MFFFLCENNYKRKVGKPPSKSGGLSDVFNNVHQRDRGDWKVLKNGVMKYLAKQRMRYINAIDQETLERIDGSSFLLMYHSQLTAFYNKRA